jgi:excisionase family DNA binding protein
MTTAKVVELEPLALSPREAGRILGVSRDHVYDLVNAEQLKACRSGNRILVDYQSVRDYYDRISS